MTSSMMITKSTITRIHFGAARYPDYTVGPHDKYSRHNFIERHNSNKDWPDDMSAGALSP